MPGNRADQVERAGAVEGESLRTAAAAPVEHPFDVQVSDREIVIDVLGREIELYRVANRETKFPGREFETGQRYVERLHSAVARRRRCRRDGGHSVVTRRRRCRRDGGHSVVAAAGADHQGCNHRP